MQVLQSGKVNYWQRNQTKLFKEEFARWCGTKYAIAVSNGSNALSLAYSAIGLSEGDEFITTARTFIATTLCGIELGAKPVFADVDKNSGAITTDTIEPLISRRTKCIVVVHLGGWPVDIS